MTSPKKTLEQVLRGTSDANIRFSDLRTLTSLGFEERIKGSHHIFTLEGRQAALNLQPDGSKAKAYQVRQVRRIYIRSTLANVPDAERKIVFDKFHIVAHLKNAVDAVRKSEHKQLKALGDDTLKGTKYLWLMGRKRFARSRWIDFGTLRNSHLKTARAWAIVETFARFWSYVSPAWATKFFDRWYAWAIRSRLEPIKKVARMLKAHLPNILTYLKHRITNALTQGFNSKIQWIKSTARGFANRDNYRIAILFHCGGLDIHPNDLW